MAARGAGLDGKGIRAPLFSRKPCFPALAVFCSTLHGRGRHGGWKFPLVCLLIALGTAADRAVGQSPSQVQYSYDAAGNLAAVTRIAIVADLTVSNLAVGAITINGNGSYNIPVMFQVNNVGTGAATATWYDRGYLSADSTLDDADQALGGFNTRSANLAAGASYAVSTTLTTSATTTAGAYTLFVKADGGAAASGQLAPTGPGSLPEVNEGNNTQSAAISLPVNKPDFTVSNASVGAITVTQSGAYAIPVTYTVTNAGAQSAAPNWFDLAYVSTDTTLDNADVNLTGYTLRNTILASGASYTVTTTYTTPTTATPGSYTLFVKADGHGTTTGGTNTDNGAIAEGNESNNAQALSLALPAKPDLAIGIPSVGTITVNQAGSYVVPVTYTVANNGGTSAVPNWYDLAYLSANATLDNADVNLTGYTLRNTTLASGASYTVTTTYTTPTTTTPGNYTLFVKADGHGTTTGGTNTDNGAVAEGNEVNNAQALALTLPAKPDLAISNLSVGAIVKNGNNSKSITVTYTVTNAGGTAALPNWFDLAYLSADAVLDNSDQNLTGYTLRSTQLGAGSSYTATTTFTTTTGTAAGTYTLFVKADGHGSTTGGSNTDSGAVAEGSETNNSASVSVVLP